MCISWLENKQSVTFKQDTLIWFSNNRDSISLNHRDTNLIKTLKNI